MMTAQLSSVPAKRERPTYTLTWTEGGKPMSEGPFRDYLTAESRARELSMKHRHVLIEGRIRYIYARWEAGERLLARSIALPAGMEL